MSRHLRRLHGDRSGQSMVLIALSLVMVVVFATIVVNTGSEIAGRQRMQTAVDAAAYSGAAVKAKALNAIAVTNVAMAVAMTIKVLLVAVQRALSVSAAIFAGICAASFGTAFFACAAAPAASTGASAMASVNSWAVPALDAIMKFLEYVARAIVIAAPAWVVATTYRVAKKNGAEVALGWPPWIPARIAPRGVLCDKVDEYIDDLMDEIRQKVESILGVIPGIGWLLGAVIGKAFSVVGYVVGGVASVICGGSGEYLEKLPEDTEDPGSMDCSECQEHLPDLLNTQWSIDVDETFWRGYHQEHKKNQWVQRERVDRPATEADIRSHVPQASDVEFRRWSDPGSPPQAYRRLSVAVHPSTARTWLAASCQDRHAGPGWAGPASYNVRPYKSAPLSQHRVVETLNLRLHFESCRWKRQPETVSASDLGFSASGGTCTGPHPHVLGEADEGCDTPVQSFESLRAGGALSYLVAAFGGQSRDHVYTGLTKDERDRGRGRLMTFAKAELHASHPDLWHTGWKARLAPVLHDEPLAESSRAGAGAAYSASLLPGGAGTGGAAGLVQSVLGGLADALVVH